MSHFLGMDRIGIRSDFREETLQLIWEAQEYFLFFSGFSTYKLTPSNFLFT